MLCLSTSAQKGQYEHSPGPRPEYDMRERERPAKAKALCLIVALFIWAQQKEICRTAINFLLK